MVKIRYGSTSTNYEEKNDSVVHLVLLQMLRIWNNFKKTGEMFLCHIGAYETFDKIAKISAKHPYLALVISVIIAAMALPFIIILGFALSTVLLTFTGFILIEGTLITIVSVLLFGCLGAVLIVFLFFGGITLASYLGFMHIFDLYNGMNKTAITNYLEKERSQTQK